MVKDHAATTSERLESALARLLAQEHPGRRSGRVSISAVAREAGVSPALVHNRYPDLAERIRAHTGRRAPQQRTDQQAELQALREVARELRQRIVGLEVDLAKLASINAALNVGIAELRAMLESRSVVPLPTRGRKT